MPASLLNRSEIARRLVSSCAFPLGLIAITVAVYAHVIDAPFVFDDWSNIVQNRALRIESFSLTEIARAAFSPPNPARPVANLSFALNVALHDYQPSGYRLVNLAVHLATTLSVYLVALNMLKLLRRRVPAPRGLDEAERKSIAFVAALLFAIHPLQIQSVTYVVQRMNSLCALFYLLAVLCFLRLRLEGSQRRKLTWAGVATFGALAAGSKEIAITLPWALILCDGLLVERVSAKWLRSRLPRQAAWALIISASLGGIYASLPFNEATPDISMMVSGLERLYTQPRVTFFYGSLYALPLPSRFNLLHGFVPSRSLFEPLTTLASLLGLLAIVAIAIIRSRVWPLASLCALWVMGHLVIEAAHPGLGLVYEHRMYLPMFGLSLGTAVLLHRLVSSKVLPLVLLALVVALGSSTYVRNAYWTDPFVLWSDVIAKNPRSPRARYNIGSILIERGDLRGAIAHYRAGIAADPNAYFLHGNLGPALVRLGRVDEALPHYQEAARLRPRDPLMHRRLAGALDALGRQAEAAEAREWASKVEADADLE